MNFTIIDDNQAGRPGRLAKAFRRHGATGHAYQSLDDLPEGEFDVILVHVNNTEQPLLSLWQTPARWKRLVAYTGDARGNVDHDWEVLDNFDDNSAVFVYPVGAENIHVDDFFMEAGERGELPPARVLRDGHVPPVYETKLAILFELIQEPPNAKEINNHLAEIEVRIRDDGDPRYWERQSKFDQYADVVRKHAAEDDLGDPLKSLADLRDLMLHGSEG